MLKFFTRYTTPLIAVIILLLRIPAIECFLKSKSDNAPLYLIMVASCPIFDSENDLSQQNDKIIAVLNIESDTVGSEILIQDPERYKEFATEMVALTNVFNKLL